MKVSYTTRDWFWLCVVLFLAFGWGSHVRYSHMIPTHRWSTGWQPDEQLRDELNRERTRATEWMNEYFALHYGMRAILNREQMERIEEKKKEYDLTKGPY